MKNLIPYFIQKHYQQHNFANSFSACSMFVDISGFTQTTEALIRSGQAEGVEVLSEILRFYFTPTVQSVYAHGGFIVGFAGDAFTAVFPIRRPRPPVARQVLAAASEIQRFFAEHPAYQSKFGTFDFGVKIGLAIGETEWGIVGSEQQKTYYFKGRAIDGCAYAEHQAGKGEMWMTAEFAGLIETLLEQKAEHNHYVRIDKINLDRLPKPVKVKTRQIDPDVLRVFYGDDLAQYTQAEFRKVAPVFIAFDGVDDLNGFISNILQELQTYGGTISHLDFGDKGGNLLFFFGAPVMYENTPARAMQFVLTIRDNFPGSSEVPGKSPTIRAGLTTGMSYCGFNGSDLRAEFTCLGNAVNQAARFMMQAEWGQILVDQELAHTPHFHCEHLGDIVYKGRGAPIPTYLLLREQLVEERVFADVMVGRETELQQLVSFTQPLFAGKLAGVAMIYGDAGIGKSRLSYALCEALRERVTWFTGQTDQIVRHAFSPFVYWLRRYFDQAQEASPDEKKRRFEARLVRLGDAIESRIADLSGDPGERLRQLRAELIRTQSFLGALLDLYWLESLYAQLDPKLRHVNTVTAIKTLLLAESCLHPVAFELEDGHWLDEASREMLLALSRNVADYPLLLVITSRYRDDGSRPTFALSPEMPTLTCDLRVLPPDTVRQQATALLSDSVSDTLLRIIQEKTQGNPFFVQQLAAYFQEQALLERDQDGRWTLIAATHDLPATITAIVIARLDRLTSRVKEIVQTAAVLGREFVVQVLSRMLRTDVLPGVQRAEEAQIWSVLAEWHYIFTHALLRDTAYAMQVRARLRDLHQLALTAYEDLYAADLHPYYADLAYHATHSADVGKQCVYLRFAGEAAQQNFANAAALEYYGQLLPLLSEAAEQFEIHLKRGQVLELMGAWNEAEADYRAALALAGQEAAMAANAQLAMGKLCRQRGDYGAALDWLAQAQEERAALGEGVGLAQVLIETGRVLWHKGEYAHAREPLNAGLTLAQEAGDKRGVALALNDLGNVAFTQGEYAAARTLYEESLAIRRELGDKRGVALALINLGNVASAQSDYAAARALYEDSLALKRDLGDKWGVALSLVTLGLVAYVQGDYAAARTPLEDSLALCREMDEKYLMAYALLGLGLLRLAEHAPEAREYILHSLRLRREMGAKFEQTSSLVGLAGLALRDGEARRAAQLLGMVESALKALNASMEAEVRHVHAQTLAAARSALGEEAFNAAWMEGKKMTLEEAVAYAL